jgi:carboxypeptidase family protein
MAAGKVLDEARHLARVLLRHRGAATGDAGGGARPPATSSGHAMPSAPRSTLILLAALTVLSAARNSARCQQPGGRADSGTVRGLVLDAGGEPIPYAVVELTPGSAQRFTDETGAFVLPRVTPGTYHLLARQVGFTPRDTVVTVAAGASREIKVVLERLTVELQAIQVVASEACTAPGPPDSVDSPELERIFDQLYMNAERYRILTSTYPFRFRMVRTFNDYDNAGDTLSTTTDTVPYQSISQASYQRGQVVAWGRGRNDERALVLNLPTLADFADTSFQRSHCFTYAGMVEDAGARTVRIAFRPAESILAPDIEGYVDLDSATYQVRRALVRLTHPGRALEGLSGASSIISFSELYPNIVVQSHIESETIPVLQLDVRKPIVRYTQEQRLLDVTFEKPLPTRTLPPYPRS